MVFNQVQADLKIIKKTKQMKKLILSVLVFGTIITSCSNNGNKAETKDAENVEVVNTNKTTVFNKVADGSHVDWRASHLGGVQPRFGKIYYKDAQKILHIFR